MIEEGYQGGETDIFKEAPAAPKRGMRLYVLIGVALLLLAWSFQGAKFRPAELFDGIPQILVTLGRMLPPDFTKITDSKNYYFPPGLSLTELFLPVPLADDPSRARQRWFLSGVSCWRARRWARRQSCTSRPPGCTRCRRR